jgi:tetratricopeptide (TPR) repeat protein
MTPERHARQAQLFLEASRLPSAQRGAFLEQACGGDRVLLEEVRALLECDAEVEREPFLERAAFAADSPALAAPPRLPASIGGYRILGELGRGGGGVVYRAEQSSPRRLVAIKVLRQGSVAPAALRRFEFEAQVLGRLQHPGIAQIFEAGTFDEGDGPQPFFAMELVDGLPLLEYARRQTLDARARLGLMLQIAEAVEHAHQKGVTHRDLKPANILVTTAGAAKVLDFGVARCSDADIQTTTRRTDVGQLVGTVAYMSPEQCTGDPAQIDTRCDVYALGVVLYELLAGRLPYRLDSALVHEAVRTIREDDPVPLGSVDRTLRGDLETIVGRALEKDKAQRYQSASDLAEDIRRFLQDEPVLARPASTAYQLRKFARRHRGLVGAVAAVMVVMAIGLVVSLCLAVSADRARRDAETARDESDAVVEFLTTMLSLANPREMGRDVRVVDLLEQAAELAGEEFALEPIILARLRSAMGLTYHGLGRVEEARAQLQEAYDIRRRLLGEDHVDTIAAAQYLSAAYVALGQHAAAQELLEGALERCRRVLGAEHPRTLATMSDLGLLYSNTQRRAEAERLLTEALEAHLRGPGERHPDTLKVMNDLAVLYQRQDRFAEALPLLERALRLQRQVLGPEHTYTVATLGNLGMLYRRQGRHADAEPLLLETLRLQRAALGDDHQNTLVALNNVGGVYADQQRHAEAEPLFAEAVERARRTLPEGHWYTGLFLGSHGTTLWKLKRYEEAEPRLLEAQRTLAAALGESHERTLRVLRLLAEMYEEWGRPEEAATFRAALEAAEEAGRAGSR